MNFSAISFSPDLLVNSRPEYQQVINTSWTTQARQLTQPAFHTFFAKKVEGR
jgi:hypothetical protein